MRRECLEVCMRTLHPSEEVYPFWPWWMTRFWSVGRVASDSAAGSSTPNHRSWRKGRARGVSSSGLGLGLAVLALRFGCGVAEHNSDSRIQGMNRQADVDASCDALEKCLYNRKQVAQDKHSIKAQISKVVSPLEAGCTQLIRGLASIWARPSCSPWL
jgi:hypothetical protein